MWWLFDTNEFWCLETSFLQLCSLAGRSRLVVVAVVASWLTVDEVWRRPH